MAQAEGSTNEQEPAPALRNNGHLNADKAGNKLADQTAKLEDKAHHVTGQDPDKQKSPAGGFDSTPIPKAPPGYTMKITFHSAQNLPFADLSLTSDPYIIAILKTDLPKRHKQDPDLKIRTPTIHRDTNPDWNVTWTIAHVPASGFRMKCRLYDEDPRDHDDRLGNIHVDVDAIDDNWEGFKERSFKVKKRMGSKRAYTLRGCASLLSSNVKMSGEVIVSVENLGKSEGDNGGQPYTVGPLPWTEHHSPLIGMIAGTREQRANNKGGKKTERYNFQAIQMQLAGPVPEALYHRYVEFRPFVAGMFTSHTLRGRILNHALHHQHARIYNFDETTKYGLFDRPSAEMTAKFLEFVRYDQGGRIFTYIITLDGQFRFTETGKEFGIDMLSKHTMHSDVSIYIAFSGEFFVRRLKHPHHFKRKTPDPATDTMPPAMEPEAEQKEKEKEKEDRGSSPSQRHLSVTQPQREQSNGQTTKPRNFSLFHRRNNSHQSIQSHASQTHEGEHPATDPSHYELIIDNDSGTYRPNSKYLPQLKKFLTQNFPGLKVATLDCQKDEEKMKRLKGEQRERKKNSGAQIMYMQNSSLNSFSSSDEEELERRVNAAGTLPSRGTLKKKVRHAKEKIVGDHEHEPERPKEHGGKDDKQHGHDERKRDVDEGHERNHEVTEKSTAEKSAIAKSTAEKSSAHAGSARQDTADQSAAEKATTVRNPVIAAAAVKATTEKGTVEKSTTENSPVEKGIAKDESVEQSNVAKSEVISNKPAHDTQDFGAPGLSDSSEKETAAVLPSEPQSQIPTQPQQLHQYQPPQQSFTESSRPTTAVLNRDNLQQHDSFHALSNTSNSNEYNQSFPQHTRQPSISTEADRMSFNTAFTDAENADHFVTPKPSLGDGGLRQFDTTTATTQQQLQSEQSAPQVVEDLSESSTTATPKAKSRTPGDVTPTGNGNRAPTPQLVHEAVTITSSSFIGGGL